MDKLTIIIPSRNEVFLEQTINDLFAKSRGEIEIIVILDGYWPDPPLKDRDNLIIIHRGASQGMRQGINSAVAIAKGKYIMKSDAHCMFDEGFDIKLIADLEPNWVSIPTRKRLDAENWQIQDVGKPDIDYMYLSYPDDPNDFGGVGLSARLWNAKNADIKLREILIDDAMSFQGSCWIMWRDYFYELELMDVVNYGNFYKEAQEIGLKCWLSGGRVVRNKKTWYAHLHKGKKYGRGYRLDNAEVVKSNEYNNKWLTDNAWGKQILPFSWLINKFAPVPGWTGKYEQ